MCSGDEKDVRLGLILLEGSFGVTVRSYAGPHLRSEMRDSDARRLICSFFNCTGDVKRWAVDFGRTEPTQVAANNCDASVSECTPLPHKPALPVVICSSMSALAIMR
jgi:hypothetical protein